MPESITASEEEFDVDQHIVKVVTTTLGQQEITITLTGHGWVLQEMTTEQGEDYRGYETPESMITTIVLSGIVRDGE